MKKENVLYYLKEALETNNSRAFATILNEFLDYVDGTLYITSGRKWKLYVGYDQTYSPSIERTRYESVRYYNLDGTYSYEHKVMVLDGKDMFWALQKAHSWYQGYSYWDRYECHSRVVLTIYGDDDLKFEFSAKTGHDCKETLLNSLTAYVNKVCASMDAILKARDNFDSSMFDNVTNYRAWVAKYLPIIIKNNGIEEKSWYDGITISNADCEFYTGRLKTCTPKGIIFWIGGDSTDDENKISYQEWASQSDYYWRSTHCGASARISLRDKEDFSKKIFTYIRNLVRDGNLK